MSLTWSYEDIETYHHFLNDHHDSDAAPAVLARTADRVAGQLSENIREELNLTNLAVAGDDRFMNVEMAIFDLLLKSNNIDIRDIKKG